MNIKHSNKTIITAEPGQREILITREFDADREKVFRLFTEPALFVEWISPREVMTTLDTFDAVNGGSFHYEQSDANGNTSGSHGVFHLVDEPDCIIQTYESENNERGQVQLDTLRFEKISGKKTRVTSQSIFQSVADRDTMINSGRARGVIESHERMDELLVAKRATSH